MLYFAKPIGYLTDKDFDNNGNLITPELQDKIVIIMIKASFCGYCKMAMPAFQETANKNKKVTVFFASIHGDGKEESFDFVKKVKALIGYVLTQHVQSGKLKKDQYKMIIDKASEKVLSKVTPEELARGRPAYEKRKDNIKKLAEDYANFYSNR